MAEVTGVKPFSKRNLLSLRRNWSVPDSMPGKTWEFDGVTERTWMGYDHEMREGLGKRGCVTFDELVEQIGAKLGRKPNVVDLMGGAYFLEHPENAASLTGIRIHDKDDDFYGAYKSKKTQIADQYRKIISAPNRRVVEADVLAVEGWKGIEAANIPKADLLVCRPVGPFDNLRAVGYIHLDDPKTFAGLYMSLFERMVKLVNKDGGIIFSEIPDVYSEEEVRDFFTGVDERKGTKTEIYTVPDQDYSWGGCQRRYAVVEFGKTV